ncbi:MAG: hypothetical protein GWP91_01920, partial [Rhodobacterales bacterium]|nr:hypothetical protein [Rhodobacterales bacterium]
MWMLWMGLAIAEPVRFIETRELVLEINHDDPNLEVLHATLSAAMSEKGIRKLARRNQDGSLVHEKVPKLTAEETLACLIVISHDKLGAEADLMVTVNGPAIPVTVWWNVQRELRVASGPAPKNLFPNGPSAEVLVADFGVGELREVDRPWEPQALGLLERALTLLSAEERAVINGLPYVRRRNPTEFVRARINNPGGGQLQATYNADRQGSRIEVYDDAFINSARFSGTPWAPRPASLGVLLHELGHAISWSSTPALVSRSEALVVSHQQ